MDKEYDLRYPRGLELQVSPSPSPGLKYFKTEDALGRTRPTGRDPW